MCDIFTKAICYTKRIVRALAGVIPREHSKPLFKKLKILTIFQINVYVIAKFMFNVYHGNSLDIFSTMFSVNSNIHSYATRQCNHFHLPLPKRELRKTSVCYRGALIWNNIMTHDIQTDASEMVFCKSLRHFILNTSHQLG